MKFNVNSPVLFALAALVVALILTESFLFLKKALKRSKELGMDQTKIRQVMKTAAIFTIAPAVSILIGVLALSKSLGIPLPWLRLSVVGSLSYETIAAANAESAMGLTFGHSDALTAGQYVTVFLVMTISILLGVTFVSIAAGKLQASRDRITKRDSRWSSILQNALFVGMISAFVGYIFSDFSGVFEGNMQGLIPVLVFLFSMLLMIICGLLLKKLHWKWIGDYALPISLLGGMVFAIPLTGWLL